MIEPEKTRWKFYTSSPEIWNAMLRACENATRSIDMTQFLFVDDEIGKRFIEIFKRRAKQGIKVRLMWDAAGSFSFFGSEMAEDLRKTGIEFSFFKTLLPPFFTIHDYRSWYLRNHRRTLIIDGKIGFTGSVCITKQTENWRETQVEIEGAVVLEMRNAFERVWEQTHGRKVKKIIKRKGEARRDFRYIINTPLPKNRFLYSQILDAVTNAQKFIYISVPYFVPTQRLSHLLRMAAKRGVDVQIILTEYSDHPVVDLAGRSYFSSFLKAGVKIYLYKGTVLHCKTMVIDGFWSTIGTMNLDRISLLYNFEANIVSFNKQFAADLVSQFNEDLKKTKEITYKDWTERYLFEKIAGFFIRIFRVFL